MIEAKSGTVPQRNWTIIRAWHAALALPFIMIAIAVIDNAIVDMQRRTLSEHFQSATIPEVNFQSEELSQCVAWIHAELCTIDPYFERCEFTLDGVNPEKELSLVLSNRSASECLRYVTELSGLHRYYVRPNRVIVAHIHSDYRGRMERITDAVIDGIRSQWPRIK